LSWAFAYWVGGFFEQKVSILFVHVLKNLLNGTLWKWLDDIGIVV
jgi:hypothetical protein